MFVAAALLFATAAPAQPVDRPPVQHLGKPSLNGQPLPFSEAVRVGDLVFLSGQIGMGADGKLPYGIDAQTHQAMDNIGRILKGNGLGWSDVVKCTVMLDNMADWPAFNKIYVGYFGDSPKPARSAFGADGLALGALVEVECWAYAGKR